MVIANRFSSFILALVILGCLFACGGGTSGTGGTGSTQFEGKIFDEQGEVVSGAAVTILETGDSAITGEDGSFSIKAVIDASQITLEVEATNARASVSLADLVEGTQTIELELRLDRNRNTLDVTKRNDRRATPTPTAIPQNTAAQPVPTQPVAPPQLSPSPSTPTPLPTSNQEPTAVPISTPTATPLPSSTPTTTPTPFVRINFFIGKVTIASGASYSPFQISFGNGRISNIGPHSFAVPEAVRGSTAPVQVWVPGMTATTEITGIPLDYESRVDVTLFFNDNPDAPTLEITSLSFSPLEG